MEKIIYTKYSNERAARFAIRTDICEQEGVRVVRKRACSPQSAAHVAQIGDSCRELTALFSGTPFSVNRCRLFAGGAELEYLRGRTLEEKLDGLLLAGDLQGTADLLLWYAGLVRAALERAPFQVTPEFAAVFGDAKPVGALRCAPATDIDMTVNNAIEQDGGFALIDYEWTFFFPIPADYVIYRILKYYIFGNPARTALCGQNLFGKAWIDAENQAVFEQMEQRFQRYVRGDVCVLEKLYRRMAPGYVDMRAAQEEGAAAARPESAGREAKEAKLRIYVDLVQKEIDRIDIHGWAAGAGPVRLGLQDESGQPVDMRLERVGRADVDAFLHREGETFPVGFQIAVSTCRPDGGDWRKLVITADDGVQKKTKTLSLPLIELENSAAGKRAARFLPHRLRPSTRYHSFREMGMFGEERGDGREQLTYEEYRRGTAPSGEELARQREEKFAVQPLISVVIPLYNTPIPYLEELLDSLLAQTYPRLEICLADGSSSDEPEAYVKTVCARDPRVRYQRLGENAGISGNTNAAIAMARGDYLMLTDHDDTVSPDALYEIVKAINAYPDAELLYTDEDKMDAQGKHYTEPHFKPDFNLYLLRSNNYICHITVVKRELAAQAGGFRREFDGAQDYDFILRCCEKAKRICHVPKVLYHWRCHAQSTAGNPESKTYAQEAGRRALEDHYRRLGIAAQVRPTELTGRYRTVFAVPGTPKVSVIIPSRDHAEDLEKCLESVARKTGWKNYEVLVVENGSAKPETFDFYRSVPERFANARVVKYEGAFNFAAINNFAAAQAQGEYLLFLNNDTEVLTAGWMQTMLGYCAQPDVGAVGAKLLYPDGTIQHAGVVLGLGGAAGHIFAGMPSEQAGYMGNAVTARNVSAVTAACMMTGREVFAQAGGFDEAFAVAFNDVDYCLRAAAAGKHVVYVPDVQLVHAESKTRGAEDTPQKRERFCREEALLRRRWGALIDDDPFYNRNLSRQRGNCSLRLP